MTTPIPSPGSPVFSFPDDPKYWEALGRFIETFGLTEVVIFNYLFTHASVPRRTAIALLGGAHADQLGDLIRRVWVSVEPEGKIREIIDKCLVQLKLINNVRGNLAHFPSFVHSEKGRITTNISRYLSTKHLKEFRISPEILATIVHDLQLIQKRVVYATAITAGQSFLREHPNAILVLEGAWRYMPPEDQPEKPKSSKQGRRERQVRVAPR